MLTRFCILISLRFISLVVLASDIIPRSIFHDVVIIHFCFADALSTDLCPAFTDLQMANASAGGGGNATQTVVMEAPTTQKGLCV